VFAVACDGGSGARTISVESEAAVVRCQSSGAVGHGLGQVTVRGQVPTLRRTRDGAGGHDCLP